MNWQFPIAHQAASLTEHYHFARRPFQVKQPHEATGQTRKFRGAYLLARGCQRQSFGRTIGVQAEDSDADKKLTRPLNEQTQRG